MATHTVLAWHGMAKWNAFRLLSTQYAQAKDSVDHI